MKKITLLVLTGLLLVTATGCATVKGFGDDVSTVWHWIVRR